VQEILKRQAQAASKMGQLIDDLLKLSRLGREEIRLSPLDLSHLAEEVAGELQADGRAGKVRFDIQPNLKATGDARLIRFVFQNFLENSCKFCGGSGVVEVGQDSAGEFFVRDQGVGF